MSASANLGRWKPHRPGRTFTFHYINLVENELSGDGGGPMPGFRIFYVDAESGHITGSQDYNADDDLDAVRQAEEYRTLSAMELWSGTRQIKAWESTKAPAESRLS